MPQHQQTIFVSSGDNAACAAEFSEALKAQGIVSRVVDEGAQVSVFYEADSIENLMPLIIAIEEKHPAATATEETSEQSSEETASPTT